ncbi:hypothetical protein AB0L30_35420 [Microbispora rosea]|uniref:hypothetical protein n=1 Tax=Microbispora rosea TaxID=58117 RepID=UPI003418A166
MTEVIRYGTPFSGERTRSLRDTGGDPGIDSGRLVRAQAVGEHMHQAVRLLEDRLRVRLHRTSRDWEDLRGRYPLDVDQEWRRSSPPRHPLPCFPRPPGERQVVRHKAYELAWATPAEAAFEMEQLDYDRCDGHCGLITPSG